ncbi:TPA: 16S rRNA (cytidine(1402)-2'-O)-methyltransferase [Legionella pneumophila]|uniref:Ribosomal RNA small subunit methyltransferase I n=1 Tax=Legionella pneumophila TaxID=446 RepID=A0A2S6F977_LEGPN|nr:16S rRNA (cytidine(1402)-2'-O)-methyltransferase [Legionella pneumophila]APF04685.1 16S rRNA (cytidine(1402)-2'-O)-methyltransferase [Legionella pneumophila subsp. fraseri]APF07674.1 16S rRNA (cytidine(1402)-2'-O)-methyltransferase [Legionella pneumophila subsp. fraseri]AUB70123.1 16S rRNA (cytidine(1402)-2'-O)-methyltransferase [Legionella pneumophila]AUB73099.1 16S rRNA (cytidine(1402)-2'-O)-methyltransferase [Legionella pneumophila]KXB24997.1 tetrapyrrole methylase [Legionella pneumophil
MTNTLATDLGTLYIVATPIGNREDISFRALNTLKNVDLILAEDTRHSKQLLTSLGIKNNLSSLHAYNEANKSKEIIEKLLHGKSIALISDAGTPLISDPGFPLVKQAHEHHIPVVPVPGACALIAALSAAGVPCDSFAFLGFLPAKQSARRHELQSLRSAPYTLVFYESTHRIIDSLNDIAEIYGQDCKLVLAKEITKSFERFVSGKIREIIDWLLSDPGHTKGEFVLIFPPRSSNEELHSHEKLLKILLEELPLKQAVAIACKLTNANKNQLYEEALKLKGS